MSMEMEKLNSVYLRRKNKIVLTNLESTSTDSKLVTAILGNIADIGYTLSGGILSILNSMNSTQLTEVNSFLNLDLSSLVGNDVNHVPLFRNFPEGVPDHNEYLFERMIGFMENENGDMGDNYKILSCGHAIDTTIFDMSNFSACPLCQRHINDEDLEDAKERSPLDELTPLKMIKLGTKKELDSIFTNLISSNTSISEQDKEDIELFFEVYGEKVTTLLPKDIVMKENLAYLVKMFDKHIEDNTALKTYAKTATDILRMVTALSDGDISLKLNCKFKKFKRKDRRNILSVLNDLDNNVVEDMLKYKKRWIRLGEILHPGEYSKKYVNAYESFQILREDVKVNTFGTKVEQALQSSDWNTAMGLLKQRPTDFTRRLDLLLRQSNSDSKLLRTFSKVVDNVPTRVLIQVREHFKFRTEVEDVRSFFPKGNVSKVKVIGDSRDVLPQNICDETVNIITKSLEKRFADLKEMGNVYVDHELVNYTVPFSQRSSTKSLNTITRGSKIDIPEQKTVRMFLHWMQSSEMRVDIDLSTGFYSSDWEFKSQVSYTNIKNEYSKHSGDLTNAPAPKGASEFLDINIEKATKNGIRYVVMNVFDFTSHGFNNHPICFAGIMGREDNTKGKVFEPKTVNQKFDVASETTACIPLILDLEEMKMVWCDISLTSNVVYNNIESNSNNAILMGKAMVNLHKANLYDLFTNHAKARGVIVENKEEADVVFSAEDGDYTPNDIDTIMAEFLV